LKLAAAGVDELLATDRLPDVELLRVPLAVELIKSWQINEAKRVLKTAFELDPDLRLVALDHPGLEAIW
jgi:hypothetical protein